MRRTARLAATTEGIAEAARLIRSGALVAFPTETVYGLGADGTDGAAVVALYGAKGRPRFNPLIAHLPDGEAAAAQGEFDAFASRLARAFWPGPLTLVVPAGRGCTVSDLARAGLGSVALRVPAHPVARALLGAVGRPVVAPSANRSGRISPTDADHVLADLDGRIDAVLADAPAEIGVESSVVACLGGTPRLLRPGGATRDAIEAVLGMRLPSGDGDDAPDQPVAPGRLPSHYAPRAAVRLDARHIRPGDAALLFGGATPAGLGGAVAILDLSPAGDLREAAAALFGHLRRLDASGAATIAVTPVPSDGLGEAINDRLVRAAADRT